ncbi:hypothetical protein CLV98_104230 [Dyadobacter jejuensis]|uniref:Uncharacterized protein n=1 Tax=Dyadobacter jejuensis TaxID=1082580 RepID=A0A316ALE0_9BACT|nr:hypothetical protein [Dyadobacter jejuensis]PWJ58371.1 hypothetical protein CLV98_104230 [Dyadobacter jejuensis]
MKLPIPIYALIMLAVGGCVEIPDYDATPEIFYNGIDQFTELNATTNEKVRENVIITIDFTDGDGDLGVSTEERSDSAFIKPYGDWGNYELVTVRKLADGTWQEFILSEDKVKWMPLLKPNGKSGPIKGKIDLNTSYLYGNSTVPVTLKFKVRIRDRALRVSNQIETDTISVPGYPL